MKTRWLFTPKASAHIQMDKALVAQLAKRLNDLPNDYRIGLFAFADKQGKVSKAYRSIEIADPHELLYVTQLLQELGYAEPKKAYNAEPLGYDLIFFLPALEAL